MRQESKYNILIYGMITSLTKYINMDPDILGGSPVIKGTRIPIEVIQARIRQGYTSNMFKNDYPQVPLKTFQIIIAELMGIGLDDFKKTYQTHTTT